METKSKVKRVRTEPEVSHVDPEWLIEELMLDVAELKQTVQELFRKSEDLYRADRLKFRQAMADVIDRMFEEFYLDAEQEESEANWVAIRELLFDASENALFRLILVDEKTKMPASLPEVNELKGRPTNAPTNEPTKNRR